MIRTNLNHHLKSSSSQIAFSSLSLFIVNMIIIFIIFHLRFMIGTIIEYK